MRVPLPADPSSAGLTRRLLRDVCERVDIEADAALLCASELVTNALLHASPPIELEVEVTDRGLRIAVYDGGAGQVAPRRPLERDATSGRGLAIVETLAHRWSVETTSNGKVVWFELDSP